MVSHGAWLTHAALGFALALFFSVAGHRYVELFLHSDPDEGWDETRGNRAAAKAASYGVTDPRVAYPSVYGQQADASSQAAAMPYNIGYSASPYAFLAGQQPVAYPAMPPPLPPQVSASGSSFGGMYPPPPTGMTAPPGYSSSMAPPRPPSTPYNYPATSYGSYR